MKDTDFERQGIPVAWLDECTEVPEEIWRKIMGGKPLPAASKSATGRVVDKADVWAEMGKKAASILRQSEQMAATRTVGPFGEYMQKSFVETLQQKAVESFTNHINQRIADNRQEFIDDLLMIGIDQATADVVADSVLTRWRPIDETYPALVHTLADGSYTTTARLPFRQDRWLSLTYKVKQKLLFGSPISQPAILDYIKSLDV